MGPRAGLDGCRKSHHHRHSNPEPSEAYRVDIGRHHGGIVSEILTLEWKHIGLSFDPQPVHTTAVSIRKYSVFCLNRVLTDII